MKPETEKSIQLLNRFLRSAIELKGQFDQDAPIDVLENGLRLLEKDLDYLASFLPHETLVESNILRHTTWLRKRIMEDKQDLCYSDIYELCLYDVFKAVDITFQKEQQIAEDLETPFDLLNYQLNQLDENSIDTQAWLITTERILKKLFPEEKIKLASYRILPKEYNFSMDENKRFKELIKGYLLTLSESYQTNENSHWNDIHPVIQAVAQSRYESGHYGDAVEACFKEINDIIKKAYKRDTGNEADGDVLMKKALSSQNPVYAIADMTTESGRSIQLGYMEIFAGAMKGIRNPKAHANVDVHPHDAWEIIIIASHLMRKWSGAKCVLSDKVS
jgi:uncharacterized protein (TIGR02391 family)